jgi:hypothetical protein
MNRPLVFLLLLFAAPLLPGEEAPVPEPPDLPPKVESGQVLEPEVTIVESEKQVTHEYRINGQLYMVKVIPTAGPPYYLLDTDGDGELDVRRDRPDETFVPQWVLFSW